jgi:Domain of unknown function (DUF1707)
VTGRASLKASDADRERVAERLRVAATEGRLLDQELEDRLAAAFSSRTYGELDAVVSDLPAAPVARRRQNTPVLRPGFAVAIAIALAFALMSAVSFTAGHGHAGHHSLAGLKGAVIWLIWLAIGLRFLAHRRRGTR